MVDRSTGLAGRRIVVGISGGIAAYKSPELVRRLREHGAEVRVVMTESATAFISPLTLQAVSGHRVHRQLLDEQAEAAMGHIELARWADQVVIAPASAGLIARLAAGLADDLLTTLVLATEARIWLAPAMNRVMWANPAVADNCRRLASREVTLLGPASGSQACGEEGPGRMIEPDRIVKALLDVVRPGPLTGRRFLVTAGPTFEDLDPVRFIGNRSSGRMGFAVAGALADAGASVCLVAGPVQLDTPPGVERVDVRSAGEMLEAVLARIDPCHGFVAVAAVADYRPVELARHKIKKSGQPLTLSLEPCPDILATVAALPEPPFVVGFAAETHDLESYARGKLERKRLDLIAANRVGDGSGFECEHNALEVYSRDSHWSLQPQSKTTLAHALVGIIAQQMQQREESTP